MLGDWGAHIIDFAHNYLKLGLPTKVEALFMDDHNKVIFPLSSQVRMQFPKRGDGLPACEILWRDGSDAVPTLDQKYHNSDASGKLMPPRLGRAGSILHRKDEQFVIHRGSHGSASRLYPRASMMDYRRALKAPSGELDHMQSFIQACMGKEKTSSPFSVGGPLTQLLMLGVIAQYLNEGFNFDRDTERITNNPVADALLEAQASQGLGALLYWCLIYDCLVNITIKSYMNSLFKYLSIHALAFTLATSFIFAQEDRPNVLFISVDDLNDWVGVYGGHPQAKTPHLDRFAQQAMVFRNASCPGPVCGPSRSALSGFMPSTTGLYGNSNNMLDSAIAKKRYPARILFEAWLCNNFQRKDFPQAFHREWSRPWALGI